MSKEAKAFEGVSLCFMEGLSFRRELKRANPDPNDPRAPPGVDGALRLWMDRIEMAGAEGEGGDLLRH